MPTPLYADGNDIVSHKKSFLQTLKAKNHYYDRQVLMRNLRFREGNSIETIITHNKNLILMHTFYNSR